MRKSKTLRLVAVLLCCMLLVPAGAQAAASQPHSWAQAEVQQAISNGLVPLDLQGDYDQPITRQEFCRLAVALVEVTREQTIAQVLSDKGVSTADQSFTDTSDLYVLQCSALGIVNGYEDGSFVPNGNITRQEAAKMLYETAKVLGLSSGGTDLAYSDTSRIMPYAINAVKFVTGQGVMNGVGSNTFAPTGLYTREQAYVTFDRLRRALQQTGTGGALSATEIFNTCSPAVCYVEVYDQQGQVLGTGSAFAVESNGKLLTNYHVIQGVYSAKVKFPDGAVYDVQKVMAYDAARDVAVLKIDAQGLATLPLGDSSALVSGETVYTLGSPQGLENTIANGIISAVSRQVDGQNYIQTTAPISSGSSGGALLNEKGECVGITTGTLSGQNLNFAVPINDAKTYLQQDLNLTLEQLATERTTVTDQTVSMMGAQVSYTGQMVGGKPDGDGKAVWPDGNYYDGQFVEGLPWGQGVYYQADSGSTYTGSFVSGKIQGDGVLQFSNGDRYEGEFQNGMMHGQGVYYFQDGSRYEGPLVNGTFEGWGTYYKADGSYYQGQFRNDNFNGEGTLYDAAGNPVQSGYWVNGVCYEEYGAA